MRVCSIVFLVVIFGAIVEAGRNIPGGYQKISPYSHEAKRAGNYAILEIQDQYTTGNKSLMSPPPAGSITFKKVILAAKQIVAGTNYWEIVEAKDSQGNQYCFEVVVFEPLGKIVYQLTSSRQLPTC